MIISTDAEKSFKKIQHRFMIKKKIQTTSNRRTLPQHNKDHIKKRPQLTSYLMVKD